MLKQRIRLICATNSGDSSRKERKENIRQTDGKKKSAYVGHYLFSRRILGAPVKKGEKGEKGEKRENCELGQVQKIAYEIQGDDRKAETVEIKFINCLIKRFN